MRRTPAATCLREAVRARCASRPSGSRKRTEPAEAFWASVGEVLGLAAEQRVPDRQREAVLEADVGADGVGEPVDPRGAVGVGAGQPGQPQRGALDRDGRVLPGPA